MKDITTEEAVQTLKDFAKYGRYYSVNTEHHMKSSINKVLDELEKKNNQMEKHKKENINASKIIRKQNLIINAMALQLSGISIWDDKKEEPLILMTEEDVKKYFERTVSDGRRND